MKGHDLMHVACHSIELQSTVDSYTAVCVLFVLHMCNQLTIATAVHNTYCITTMCTCSYMHVHVVTCMYT